MGDTSMNEAQPINHYSKLIPFEPTRMIEVNLQCEDLEYLNTINTPNQELLSKIAVKGLLKQPLSELIVVRFGRSIVFHFESFHYYFALSVNLIHHNHHRVLHSRV